MSDQPSGTGPTAERSTDRTPFSERWLDERPVTEATLPPDVARAMEQFYGADSVGTLEAFVAATRAAAGGSIDVEDLCHVEGETPHRATTAEGIFHFRCFYDGVALALLADEPVEIRTESPAGTPIDVQVSADGDVEASPATAAMSLGVAADAPATDGAPTPAAVYGAICPYVRAFPTRERYERWAAGAAAATVGMPLDAGVPIAGALIR